MQPGKTNRESGAFNFIEFIPEHCLELEEAMGWDVRGLVLSKRVEKHGKRSATDESRCKCVSVDVGIGLKSNSC